MSASQKIFFFLRALIKIWKKNKNLYISSFSHDSIGWRSEWHIVWNLFKCLLSGWMQCILVPDRLKCQFISYKFEIWTNTLAQEVGHCMEHNPLFDKTKIPLWAIIFVYSARVAFTRFAAPPPLFLLRPGVISMRINVAINHSVPPLPDVIQGLLKTSALCDVYGRREIWAWQPSPIDPCEISLWDTHTVSLLLPSWIVPNTVELPPLETETITAGPDRQLDSISDWSGSLKVLEWVPHTYSLSPKME